MLICVCFISRCTLSLTSVGTSVWRVQAPSTYYLCINNTFHYVVPAFIALWIYFRMNCFKVVRVSQVCVFTFLKDLEKLSTFSQRFPLPSMYRTHVWKVLLGKTHTHITHNCMSNLMFYAETSQCENEHTSSLCLQASSHPTVTLTLWLEATGKSSTRTSWRPWR